MSKIFESIFEELDQINDIIHPDKRYSETHKAILMKSRLFALKTKLNQSILAEDLDPEARITGYLQTIDKLKRILSYQHHESNALFWFELHMFHQLLVAHIIMINGAGGRLGIIGLAHALADLLVGLDVKNPMTLLTDPDDPEWPTRINIAYNLANGQVSLYATLMQQLAFMPKEEAVEFTSKILEGIGQVESLLERTWNPEKILKSRTSIATDEDKVNSVLVLANASYNLGIAHYNFWPRFGNRLGGIEGRFTKNQATTSSEFFKRVSSLLEQTDKRIEQLRQFMAKDRELKNIALDQFPSLQFSQMQKSQVAEITRMIEAIHNILNGEKLPSDSSKFLESFYLLLDSLSPYLANEQLMYNSVIGEVFASFSTYYLYISGFFSIEFQKPDILYRTQEKLAVFLKQEGKSHFPLVHIYNQIATLALDSRMFPEKIVGEEYMDRTNDYKELLESLNFYPREKLSLGVISTMISYYRGEGFAESMNYLKQITEDYGIEGKIKDTLEEVCSYLDKASKGEKTVLNHYVEPAALDHFSVLKPDFSKVAELSSKLELDYLPFNSLQLSVYDRD